MAARSRRKRGFAVSRSDLARVIPVAVLALLLLWLTVAVSGANLIRANRPDLALGLMPFDARAKARASERHLEDLTRPGAADEARRLAREALSRDATVASAWRMLGFAASLRGEADARGYFRIAEAVSRRDSATQIWLIEDSVRRDDIAGALHHYDAALRVSRSTHNLLLPILARAVNDEAIAPPLAQLLARAPAWRRWFLVKLTELPPEPDKAVRFFGLLRRAGPLPDQDLVALLVDRYAQEGHYVAAARIYGFLVPDSSTELVRNGGFEHDNPVPPFDWRIEHGPDVGADQRPADGGRGLLLQAYANGGATGPAASQLMMLAPGRYTLRTQSGTVGDARPAVLSWRILCAHEQTTRLAEQALPVRQPGGEPSSGIFTVPAGCPAQLLVLNVRSDDEGGNVGAWVDSVAIRPAAASARP